MNDQATALTRPFPGVMVVLMLGLAGLGGSWGAAQQHPRAASRVDEAGIPRVVGGLSQRVSGSTPEEIASAVLQNHSVALHLEEVTLNPAAAEAVSTPTGLRIIIPQTVGDVPVYRGGLVVVTAPNRQIRLLVNDLVYGLDLPRARPDLSAQDAIDIALQHLSPSGTPIDPPRATLFVLRSGDSGDHLAYRVTVTLSHPYGDWEVFVDALTGDIVSVRDQFVHNHAAEYVQGQGAVYRSDPLSELGATYGDPGLVDNDDADSEALTAARRIVLLDSLRVEDGLVYLSGPFCTVTDIEAPSDPVAFTAVSPDAFHFTRSQPGFEAVMVYYHATASYRRLQELGFEIPRLRTLRLDPHGYNGQDNSHYSPSGNWISFGTGGVDDAEDADVIWHEYGHAIIYCLIPYWGGGEAGALGEGYADYWAASHSRSLGQWQPGQAPYHWLFRWDGHNPFWQGRIVNASGTYPFGSLGIHAAGQIWASALMGIHADLGRDVTDRLVMASLYYLGASPTGQDAALALLQADRDLYGGAHLTTLLYWLQTVKHFLPAEGGTQILVIADDHVVPADSQRAGLTGQPPSIQVQPGTTPFSTLMGLLALPEGHGIQSTSFASFDTTALAGSPLVVLLGGLNPRPFDDGPRRDAIVRYIRGGGRVLVEGGEVGFVYTAGDAGGIDETFRREVLHSVAHAGDALGASFVPDAAAGSLFATPNVISRMLAFRQPGSFAQRDVIVPESADPGVSTLGRWSGEENGAGMLLYRSAGQGASLLVPFALSALEDSIEACLLMENLLAYMLQPVLPATAVGEEEVGIPSTLTLHQNYPNPFNPSTTIRFALPGAEARYEVTIEIFDDLGRSVATPLRASLGAGTHEVRFDAGPLPSGVYFCRLSAIGGLGSVPQHVVGRMLLVR